MIKRFWAGICAGIMFFGMSDMLPNCCDKKISAIAETIAQSTNLYDDVADYEKQIFNGHEYQLFDNGMDWVEAKEYCESLGGHLVTISSQAEQSFLTSLIEQNTDYIEYIIGLYYDEGIWKWVDGTEVTYTNWNENMPDNWTGDEYYGYMYTSSVTYSDWTSTKGMWNDAQNYATPFICEWDSEMPPTLDDVIDYEKQIFNGHEYQLFDNGMNWIEAKEYCESLGGHLVTISSQAEQNFLTSLIEQDTDDIEYIIGLYYDEGIWKWVDGTEVTYSNWNVFERDGIEYYMPDNWVGDEYYGYMYTSSVTYSDWASYKGMWNDAQNYATTFICEWDSETLPTIDNDGHLKLNYTENLTGTQKEVELTKAYDLELYACNASSKIYQPQLAYLLSILATSAYTEDDIEHNLKSLGFKDYNLYNYYDSPTDSNYEKDSCGFSIAQKSIANGDTLVLVTVRGSYGSMENILKPNSDWNSNLNIWMQELYGAGKHTGFNTAMQKVFNQLKQDLGGSLLTSNVKYVITGHSRGAGISNLLAKELCDAGVSSYDVFDYNFACPDVAKATATSWNSFSEYDNIFNIGVAGDMVTVIPGITGNVISDGTGGIISAVAQWGKYGRSYWFSKNWNVEYGATVVNLHEHAAENYISHMSWEMELSQAKTWKKLKLTEYGNCISSFSVMCPVDVEITDIEGNVLATVRGEEVTYNSTDDIGIIVWTEGDQKHFIVLGKSELNVNLKGTDEGTMNCIVSIVPEDSSRSESVVYYENVELYAGKTMKFVVSGDGTKQAEQIVELDAAGTVISTTDPVYFMPSSLYGDVNLDNAVDAKDAAKILVYAATIGSGKTAYLYSESDADQEHLAYSLADVDNTGESDSPLDAKDAAVVLVYAAAAGSGNDVSWIEVTDDVF